jgi:hypothetical protein
VEVTHWESLVLFRNNTKRQDAEERHKMRAVCSITVDVSAAHSADAGGRSRLVAVAWSVQPHAGDGVGLDAVVVKPLAGVGVDVDAMVKPLAGDGVEVDALVATKPVAVAVVVTCCVSLVGRTSLVCYHQGLDWRCIAAQVSLVTFPRKRFPTTESSARLRRGSVTMW